MPGSFHQRFGESASRIYHFPNLWSQEWKILWPLELVERDFVSLSATERFALHQVIKLKIAQGSVFVVDGGDPTTDDDFIMDAFSKGSTLIEIAENS